MSTHENIINKAKSDIKTIVLPESKDKRIQEASKIITDSKIADVILIGDKREIGLSENDSLKIINHKESPKREEYAREFLNSVKSKKRIKTIHDALALLENELYFGCMLAKVGEADGMVSGSLSATADTIRAALRVIGIDTDKNSTLSSFFLIEVPEYAEIMNREFLFADCGVVPNPTEEELADIAIATADSAKRYFEWEPRVAMLSFSTKGSARGSSVSKVVSAVKIARKKRPDIIIDGELQLDAAVIPEVASKKDKDSVLKGRANVLIFPDLNSGNIGYKLVERMAKARAIGPILQGLKKPVNDLSRGCSVDDVVGAVAVTAVQSQEKDQWD